jgi:hypothetical protein
LIYRINTRWNGNAGYSPNTGVYDEVYIFRPDGNTPTQNGNLNIAHFGPNGRTTFDANSNPKPFLTEGTYLTDFSITDITVNGNEVSFTYYRIEPQFHEATFHPNGGEGEMLPQLFEEEVEQELSPNIFTFEGMDFTGWAITPDGEVEYEDRQSIIINEDIVLYAVWQTPPPPPVYYTITANMMIPVKCAAIDPEGEVKALENTDQSFIIQSDGCEIAGVEIDGEWIPNDGDPYYLVYTFENVTEDHQINAHVKGSSVNKNINTNVFFSIQPNPATQYFEIVLPSSSITSKGITAQIFDVQGLLLKTVQIFEEITRIDISNFAKGFYIVKIDKEAKKLIVK